MFNINVEMILLFDFLFSELGNESLFGDIYLRNNTLTSFLITFSFILIIKWSFININCNFTVKD